MRDGASSPWNSFVPESSFLPCRYSSADATRLATISAWSAANGNDSRWQRSKIAARVRPSTSSVEM